MRANGTFVLSEEWTDADTAIGRVSEGLDFEGLRERFLG